LKTVLSYWALPGPPNRFEWNRSTFREVFDFGIRMLLSSTFSFLLTSGDRIVPGRLLDVNAMGLYWSASQAAGFFGGQLILQAVRLIR
jgi:O-antigen/teichoic acid export membrane protein